MRQDSHRGDVVHAVCRDVALLVAIESVEGESTPRRVVRPPLGLIAGPRRYGGPILQRVAQCRRGELALVSVGHRGEKGEGGAGGAMSGLPPAAPASPHPHGRSGPLSNATV